MVMVFCAAKRHHPHEHHRRPVLRLAPRKNDDVELTIKDRVAVVRETILN